jgi:hypothetical protein
MPESQWKAFLLATARSLSTRRTHHDDDGMVAMATTSVAPVRGTKEPLNTVEALKSLSLLTPV